MAIEGGHPVSRSNGWGPEEEEKKCDLDERTSKVAAESILTEPDNVSSLSKKNISYKPTEKSKAQIIEAVKKNPSMLRDLSAELKNDKEIVRAAIKADPEVLEEASREVQIELVTENPRLILYSSEVESFSSSLEHARILIKEYPDEFQWLDPDCQQDLELATLAIENNHKLVIFLPLKTRVELIMKNPDILSWEDVKEGIAKADVLPDEFYEDKQVMEIAVDLDPSQYLKVSELAKEDLELARKYYKYYPRALQKRSEEFQTRYFEKYPASIFMAHNLRRHSCVKRSDLPKSFFTKKSIVVVLLAKFPLFYQQVPSPLANDMDVLRLASKSFRNFQSFGEDIQEKFMMEDLSLMKASSFFVEGKKFPEAICNSKPHASWILKNAPLLMIFPSDLSSDKEAILKGRLEENPAWINCMPLEKQEFFLQENHHLFEHLVVNDLTPLPKFTPDFLKNVLCMVKLLKHHPSAMKSMLPEIKNDRKIVANFVKETPGAIDYFEIKDAIYSYVVGVASRYDSRMEFAYCMSIHVSRKEYWLGYCFDITDESQAKLLHIIDKKAGATPNVIALGKLIKKHYGKFISSIDSLLKIQAHFVPTVMTVIFLSSEEVDISLLAEAFTSRFKGKFARIFRNQSSGLQDQLLQEIQLLFGIKGNLNLIYCLLDSLNGEPEDCIDFLAFLVNLHMIPGDDISLEIMKLIIDRGSLENKLKQSKMICQKYFSKMFGNSIEGVEKLPSCKRSYKGVIRYACKFIGDPKMREIMQTFFSSALSGTFIEERMKIDENPHLAQFQKSAPEKFKKWAELHGAKKEYEGKLVTVSGNWEDFFMMGTEVASSCQNVLKDIGGGGIEYAKTLMGYCMDGRDHLLVIHQEDGSISSRINLRQVFVDGKPALILFQPMATNKDTKTKEKHALFLAAKEIAKDLEMPLYDGSYRSFQGFSVIDKTVCKSDMGRAPYVYDDSTHNIYEGPFEVEMYSEFPILSTS